MSRRRKHPQWQWAGIVGAIGIAIIIVVGSYHIISESTGAVVDAGASDSATAADSTRPARPSASQPGSAVSAAPSEALKRVVFIGDSYSAGVGNSDHSKRWTTIVAKAEGWREINIAKGATGYLTTSKE